MKKKFTLSFVLILALILQIFAMPFASTASASTQNGLRQSNGKIYYYKNGKKLKNKWKTVKGNRYYFGKNGAAYKGYKLVKKTRYYFDKNCRMVSDKVVKINGHKYYFLESGKSAKNAVRVNGKIWKVSKGGRLLKNINAYAKRGKSFDAFLKVAGKPNKSSTTPSCNGPGKDGIYDYDNFTVYTSEYKGVRTIIEVSQLIAMPTIYD